jgi:hypothetical protein
MSDRDQQGKAVRINSWGFETGDTRRPRAVSLLGIFLICLGVVMAAGEMLGGRDVALSSLLLAVGIVLLVYWGRQGSTLALYAGIFLTSLSAADLLTALHVLSGNGWGTLFLGIGILALVPIRSHSGQSWGGAALLGGLLAFWGGSDVASHYLNFALDRFIGPLLLVLLGVYLVGRAARSGHE